MCFHNIILPSTKGRWMGGRGGIEFPSSLSGSTYTPTHSVCTCTCMTMSDQLQCNYLYKSVHLLHRKWGKRRRGLMSLRAALRWVESTCKCRPLYIRVSIFDQAAHVICHVTATVQLCTRTWCGAHVHSLSFTVTQLLVCL